MKTFNVWFSKYNRLWDPSVCDEVSLWKTEECTIRRKFVLPDGVSVGRAGGKIVGLFRDADRAEMNIGISVIDSEPSYGKLYMTGPSISPSWGIHGIILEEVLDIPNP